MKKSLSLTLLAVAGLIIYIIVVSRRDDKRNIMLTISYLLLIFAFFIPGSGRIWNARLLPYIYITAFFIAGYALFVLFGFLMIYLKRYKNYISKIAMLLFVPLIAITVFAVIMPLQPKASGWASYNYSGYETKPYWKIYSLMMEYIKTKPEGRYMVEQDHDNLSKLGTTRAFELIPFWTDSSVMEGLLVEGSFTSPFHFVNQALLSKKPSNAIPGLKQPPMNINTGIQNLKMMNIGYMIASSPEVISELDKNSDAELMAKFDAFYFYKINTSGRYIEVLKNIPVKVKTDEWYDTVMPWFKKYDTNKTYIIWDQGEKGLDEFKTVLPPDVIRENDTAYSQKGEVISESVENERITFKTTALGIPHIIKISYFPNWKAEGADGPFAISPSFMMVIPRQEEVTLYYGSTTTDVVSRIITQCTWVFLLLLLIYDRTKYLIKKRNNK